MTRRQYWARLDDPSYRERVKREAQRLKSDGCSGVPDWYVIACFDHDIMYRTHRDVQQEVVTRQQADQRLRWAIQHESPFGRLSPMSWWRWAAVRLAGRKAWGDEAHA